MAIDFSSEIENIKGTIASGALVVVNDGRRVEYDTFEKMLARLSWLEEQQAQAAGGVIARPVASFAAFCRGDS